MIGNQLFVFSTDDTYELLDKLPFSLPPDVLERVLRYRKVNDRNNFIAARWILYELMIQKGIFSAFGHFDYNSYGKPSIDGFLCFSISHTDGLTVVAVSSKEIGVDVEKIQPVEDLSAFRNVFSDEEWKLVLDNEISAFYSQASSFLLSR